MTAVKGSTLEQARAAKAKASTLLQVRSLAGSVGITRLGTGYAVQVDLITDGGKARPIPKVIDGVPVRVAIVGSVRKRTLAGRRSPKSGRIG